MSKEKETMILMNVVTVANINMKIQKIINKILNKIRTTQIILSMIYQNRF
jgi:hypothetical protein